MDLYYIILFWFIIFWAIYICLKCSMTYLFYIIFCACGILNALSSFERFPLKLESLEQRESSARSSWERTYTGNSVDSSFSGAACHRRIGNIFRLSLSLHNTLVSSTVRRCVGFPLKRAWFLAQSTSFSRCRDTYGWAKIEKTWLHDLVPSFPDI